MTFVFLSSDFYRDYASCTEIEQKTDRPYVQVCVNINGYLFAIPLRSHIQHPHVLWTDRENRCGLDFSKAVVLLKQSYVDSSRKPRIRPNEFDSLRGKERTILQQMKKYIATYKKAKKRLDVPRNQTICQYSTLQYFERYI